MSSDGDERAPAEKVRTDLELLRVRELSERLGIPPSGLYSLVKRREIPHVRIGKRVYFDFAEVLRWIRANSVEPKQEARSEKVLEEDAAG